MAILYPAASGFIIIRSIPIASVFSGIVTDKNSNPVKRKLLLVEPSMSIDGDSPDLILGETFSDETTGEYSFVANKNSNDRLCVICFGDDGENTLAFSDLAGL